MPSTSSTVALSNELPLAGAPRDATAPARARAAGALAASWGVAAQVALLLLPARQLAHAGVDALAAQGVAWSFALAAASVAALCYLQGYRGFQRRYAPLVAARAVHLARHPRPWHAALAPLYVCGLVHASPRRRRATALVAATMPVLALAVGALPQPYRAAVEVGVAFGLLWGVVAVLAFAIRAAGGRPPAVPLDLPAGGCVVSGAARGGSAPRAPAPPR